jgi:hypothetical protein
MTTLPAFAQTRECTFETCAAGTKALTYFEKSDPYYACPTRELATYVTTIVGLTAVQATLSGGQMPNISNKNGELEYTGQTKEMVDMLREKAGVRTFDQAVALCAPGVDKRPVTILNMPENSLVAYVEDRHKKTFWMSSAHLDKMQ